MSVADVREVCVEKAIEMIVENKDINTVLLELEQKIDLIAEEYGGKK